jgi:hypothetical protein
VVPERDRGGPDGLVVRRPWSTGGAAEHAVPPQPLAAIVLCGARGERCGGVWCHQLTTLSIFGVAEEFDEDDEQREEEGEWVLDLSRLTSLVVSCAAVTDKEVQALSSLTGLTNLNLRSCINVRS